ncbi:MAG TPA: glycerate kinase [Gaiellaceae bacterium]|nr:glycerate kinase [Gaiellaceae bacterium]
MRALASPASLKGVLSAGEAAAALVEGLRSAGAEAVELPVADGGEGTLEVLNGALGGEWRDAVVSDPLGRKVTARWLLLPGGVAAVESAQAIGLTLVAEEERDVMQASSRGLGELILAALAADPRELIFFLGGTATVDGGLGLFEVVGELRIPVRAACDVRSKLFDAVWVFAEQKGATPEQLPELERRLLDNAALEPFRDVPGAGAAGGLGAALAALGAELIEGAPLILELIGFPGRLRDADLALTGEGSVDRSTWLGKAPAAVLGACQEARVRCVLFGGRVLEQPAGVEVYELSGDPARAREDLVELAEWVAAS